MRHPLHSWELSQRRSHRVHPWGWGDGEDEQAAVRGGEHWGKRGSTGKVLRKQKQGKEESRKTPRGAQSALGSMGAEEGQGFVTTVSLAAFILGVIRSHGKASGRAWYGQNCPSSALCGNWIFPNLSPVSRLGAPLIFGSTSGNKAARIWTFWSVCGSYYVPINRYELWQGKEDPGLLC